MVKFCTLPKIIPGGIMRRVTLVLILSLSAVCLWGYEINGGLGGFSFGRFSYDTKDINERFAANGVNEIEDMVYIWGGGGYGIIRNVVIGGSGAGGGIKTESDSVSIKINMGYGLFEAGYLFPLGSKIAIFPLFGIGGGGTTIYLRPDLGDVDFDDILTPDGAGRTTSISSGGFIGSLGLGAIFRFGEFIVIYAKGSYLRQFGGDWQLEDGSMLKNEPDFRINGPSFSIGLAFGGLVNVEELD